MVNTKMSRFSTNVNGYIGKSQKFTSVEAEEYSGVSGGEPALLSNSKLPVDVTSLVAATTAVTFTTAQSGTTFLVPAITAVCTITLPDASADTIGVHYDFIWTDTQVADLIIDSRAGNTISIIVSFAGGTEIDTAAQTAVFDQSVGSQLEGCNAQLLGITATSWALKAQSSEPTLSVIGV